MVNLLFKNGETYKMKEVSGGERAERENRRKRKGTVRFGLKKNKKKQHISLCHLTESE